MKNRSLFVHFNKDEHPFVERVLDWIQQARKHQIVTTPFLDPREQDILESLVNHEGELMVQMNGGCKEAERKRAVLFPEYLGEVEPSLFSLAFLRITTGSGTTLSHRDVLGSILSLGIERKKVGDIYPTPSGADLVVVSELKDFFLMEWQKIGRQQIRIEEIGVDDLSKSKDKKEVKSVTVSSLRIDVVLSSAFRLSRNESTAMVKSGKAKLNWRLVQNPSTLVKEGDLISLRHYGRTKIEQITGRTKKGKIILKISSLS